MPSAVFFDLDNTLFDRDAALKAGARVLLGSHWPGLPVTELEAIAEDFLAAAEATEDRHQFLAKLASSYPGIAQPHVIRELDDAYLGSITPIPGALQMVRDVAARYRTGIITNGSRRMQRAKLARLGLTDAVGAVFISAEQGVAKPNPVIFARAQAWAACPAHECLMIGDDPAKDIAGAARAGWQTCWVSWGRTYPHAHPAPDLVIRRITDLREVLLP